MANKTLIQIAQDFLAIVRKSRVGTVLPYEMAAILNQATEVVVANKFKSIESDKKAFNDLLPLKDLVKATMTATDTNDLFPNKTVALPDGFRRDIRLVVQFGSADPTKMILIRSNETTDILNGVFSRPDIYQTYYTFYNASTVASLKVYIGTITTALTYVLEYYKQPTLISATDITAGSVLSQFGSEMNQEIVEMAALMYLERVQDARVQSFSNEINNK